MKTAFNTIFASVILSALLINAAQANPQHERMRRCNAEAKEQSLKGDERKSFMSTCLRGKHTPVAATKPPSEQASGLEAAAGSTAATARARQISEFEAAERSKACNLAATEQSLSGAARLAYLDQCSKG